MRRSLPMRSAAVLLAAVAGCVPAACATATPAGPNPAAAAASTSEATPASSTTRTSTLPDPDPGGPITVVAPGASGDSPAASPTDAAPSDTTAPGTASAGTPLPGGAPRTTTAEGPAAPTVVETTVTSAPRGTVVVIDPGHNGSNGAHPEIINRQVPAGFGQTKACNTTGTATDAGYAEHAFNWQVSLALRDLLTAQGIEVRMTRDSDDGVGPCVDERAAIGNDANAAAVISIHGDGADPSVSGFFLMTSSHEPGGPDIAAATEQLASAVRDSLVDNGFHTSTIGTNGLWARDDLGGLNLSLVPSVMIELGNMRNAEEARVMSSTDGQQAYAAGIARGVLAYLAER